ncbi:P-loop containing nucleoside triphosphate hydrolase protein [Mariannaea sp. PMI_226]|nr:P-loop containing nucleoside triphosphate hydrolase protein [Mariannaea sp. PMI_226]
MNFSVLTHAKALYRLNESLRACDVRETINPTQIIVMVDLSSGKSSVIEAICDICLPADVKLYSRFGTEVVFRQADKTRVHIGLIYADALHQTVNIFRRSDFCEADLPEIISEGIEYMRTAQIRTLFSNNTLRVEIDGPSRCPLILVDLPIPCQSEATVQTPGCGKLDHILVDHYMRQKNTVILMVFSANDLPVEHIALSTISKFDPQKQRTIGVITRSDRVDSTTEDEQRLLRLIENKEGPSKLHLGWHLLREQTKEEVIDDEHEVDENFFNTPAWASISKKDCGNASLCKKLHLVLYRNILKDIPDVVEGIDKQLEQYQEELQQFGNAKSDQEIRLLLLNAASQFQRLARDGIHGRYDDPFFRALWGDRYKLRAILRNLNQGAKQLIIDEAGDALGNVNLPDFLENLVKEYPDVFPSPETITRLELRTQLQKQEVANQGYQFPRTLNIELAIHLFRKQITPWKRIAEFHMNCVTASAKTFVNELFRHILGPPNATKALEHILSNCVNPFFEQKEKQLQRKLEELLQPYSQGYAFFLDEEFHRSLSQMSTDRLAKQLHGAMEKKYPEIESDSGIDRVIESMVAYYEMSRRTFTDNVINLAIENCLISDIPDILTPTRVEQMSKERVEELDAELDDGRPRRTIILGKMDILRQGLVQCQRYMPKSETTSADRLAETGNQQSALPLLTAGVSPKASGLSTDAKKRPATRMS